MGDEVVTTLVYAVLGVVAFIWILIVSIRRLRSQFRNMRKDHPPGTPKIRCPACHHTFYSDRDNTFPSDQPPPDPST